MTLRIDLHELVNGAGKQTNFSTLLIKLIFKADQHNREQLRKGFPNAVKMIETYKDTGEILDLEYD